MTTAIYPGRFDPVTAGHLDIVKRASRLFDEIIIAVFDAPEKRTMFSTAERVSMFQNSINGIENVQVKSFNGLIVDYARSQNAKAIVRGIRMNSDFEYEFEMALINRKLSPYIDVVCLMTDIQYQFVRASLLKEVAKLGGDIEGLAPPNVILELKRRIEHEAGLIKE